MTKPKAPPDGWIALHPKDGLTDCYDYNANDCFNKWWRLYLLGTKDRTSATDIFNREGWTINPVCLVSPEEKARIVPQELLDFLEWLRVQATYEKESSTSGSSYNHFAATILSNLSNIWPERVK